MAIGSRLLEDARLLDRHYAPPRYPNLHPSVPLPSHRLYSREGRRKVHKLSSKDRRLYEEVLERLRSLVTETRDRLKPKLVILYGSFVRGDWHKGSDLDLLVVSDNVPQNFMDRGDPLYTVIMGFPTEPHVYTTQEFEEMLTHGRMTALDALTDSVIIHADKRFMKKVEKMLKKTMKNLEPQK